MPPRRIRLQDVRVPRAGAVSALAVALIIAGHTVFHRDAAGWIAKGATRDTVALEGHLVEWEWLHVGATVRVLDPQLAALPAISTQDAFRFVPGLLVAALRGPAGGLYGAALAATLVAWGAAAAAVAHAAGRVWSDGQSPARTDGRRAALALTAGGVLLAQGTGYIAFLGNVDAHQFGYAAVALWCGFWVLFRLDESTGFRAHWRSIAVGLALCVAGYAMEVSYPLLLSAWLLLVAAVARRVLSPRDAAIRAGVLTAAFLVPYVGFQLVVRASFGSQLIPLNDPVEQIEAQLADVQRSGPTSWLASRLHTLAIRWPAAFPLPVSLLAVIGLFVVPRRWALWALLLLVPLLGAVTVTKLIVRTIFLIHPPVYVLAAGGGAWLADRVGTLAPRVRWASEITLVAILALASIATNADLWGDYFIPVWWWRIQ